MPITPEEEPLARLVHQAIDGVRPRAGAEDRVLASARERVARGTSTTSVWRRGLGGALIALAVVAVLGGAVGITLGLRGHALPAPATKTPTSHPPTAPVIALPTPTPPAPLPFDSTSYSFASPSDGWTIGSACDPQNTCIFGVFKTTDGGATWKHLPYPFKVDTTNFSLEVTGASSSEAWVWGMATTGQSVIASTHNAGASWQEETTGNADVADMVIAGGAAWAVTTCVTTAPCTARLYSQPISGGLWTSVALPASVQAPIDNNSDVLQSQVLREDDRMWVLDANQGRPALVLTNDNGRTWASLPAPPCRSGATMVLAASSMDNLMLACALEGAWPAPQEIWTSDDGGYQWTLRSREYFTMLSPSERNVGSINSGGAPTRLVVLSNSTAWMVNDREDDLVTHDDGVTWVHASLPPDYFGGAGGAEGIGFTDSLHGWTFASGGLWTTSDGGVTWHEQPGITVAVSCTVIGSVCRVSL